MIGTNKMTVEEKRNLLAQAKQGIKISTPYSVKPRNTINNSLCDHFWRCILCVDDKDVLECANCGDQKVVSCGFDNLFA